MIYLLIKRFLNNLILINRDKLLMSCTILTIFARKDFYLE